MALLEKLMFPELGVPSSDVNPSDSSYKVCKTLGTAEHMGLTLFNVWSLSRRGAFWEPY